MEGLITPLDRWEPLSVTGITGIGHTRIVDRNLRLNSLASLYFFSVAMLGRTRFTPTLHKPLASAFQRVNFQDVFEIPRGHFKSSLVSECMTIWRTLRVSEDDANEILKLRGWDDRPLYNHDFVDYLVQVHQPDQCWLIASENLTNAKRIMRRIRQHYESRDLFRRVFSDMLPYEIVDRGQRVGRYKGKWNDEALCVNRDDRTRGESTFECIGVGSAVQSRHYDGGIIQDDIVGKAAMESEVEMEKTIDWHRLLAGVFDSSSDHAGNEMVIGNRWSFADLNSWIRENRAEMTFHTMSALRCPVCGNDGKLEMDQFTEAKAPCICGEPMEPIFPESFTIKKLKHEQVRLGRAHFSSQYLNTPGTHENAAFRERDLRWYAFEEVNRAYGTPECYKLKINHLGADCVGIAPVRVAGLRRFIAVDPALGMGGIMGSRHAIVVTGVADNNNKYLLDVWAEYCSMDLMLQKLYQLAEFWGVPTVHVEAIGAFQLLVGHINTLNEMKKVPIRAEPLKGFVESVLGTQTNRKDARIAALAPMFEQHLFFARADQSKFRDEYISFPKGRTKDILDALAYGPAIWQRPMRHDEWKMLQYGEQALNSRNPVTGY